MPQVKRGSRGAGLHVPGVYQALLGYERAKYERRGEAVVIDGRKLRVSWRDKDDHAQGFFLWPRHRLDQLEASESLLADCGAGEHALWERDSERDPSAPRPRLPFGRRVRSVRVSPDDRVVPAADLYRGDRDPLSGSSLRD
jgi:hypothetical protein